MVERSDGGRNVSPEDSKRMLDASMGKYKEGKIKQREERVVSLIATLLRESDSMIRWQKDIPLMPIPERCGSAVYDAYLYFCRYYRHEPGGKQKNDEVQQLCRSAFAIGERYEEVLTADIPSSISWLNTSEVDTPDEKATFAERINVVRNSIVSELLDLFENLFDNMSIADSTEPLKQAIERLVHTYVFPTR